MHHPHAVHHAAHVRRRAQARPEPVPRNRIPHITIPEGPSPVRRSPMVASSSSSARSTCGPNDDSPACEKPASTMTTTTLPVVLGAVYVDIINTTTANSRTNCYLGYPSFVLWLFCSFCTEGTSEDFDRKTRMTSISRWISAWTSWNRAWQEGGAGTTMLESRCRWPTLRSRSVKAAGGCHWIWLTAPICSHQGYTAPENL